jgi:hypothetical protein
MPLRSRGDMGKAGIYADSFQCATPSEPKGPIVPAYHTHAATLQRDWNSTLVLTTAGPGAILLKSYTGFETRR